MEESRHIADAAAVPCPDYDPEHVRAALTRALEDVGGLDWVRSGMNIVIKANLVSAMRPDSAATTHPVVISELTKLLVGRGARVVIGDSPGGIFSAAYLNHVYAVTDMRSCEAAGAELNRDYSQREADFPGGKVLKRFTYTGYLDGADAIIDVCKLKSHGMMGMSAAVKNMFGAIPGTMKPEYHFKYPDHADFADMLVDLNLYFAPRLAIADAVVGMEGNGPTAGTPRHMGAILASRSTFRLDLACAEILGLDSAAVPTLKAAALRGLAPETAAELDISGDLEPLRVQDFKHSAVRTSLRFSGDGKNPAMRAVSAVLSGLLSSKPALQRDRCVGCGVCARTCPAHAIDLSTGKAVINRKECIKCFCCQEFCPKGAMVVRRSLVARVAGKL